MIISPCSVAVCFELLSLVHSNHLHFNNCLSSNYSRFVLNVPKEDQQSFERILFLVEYAHWFYEDNSVENNPSLKSFTLKEFTSLSILLILFFFFLLDNKCIMFLGTTCVP